MFSKIWKFIKKILPFLIVLLIVFAPEFAGFFSSLGWTGLASAFTAVGTALAPLGFWGALAVGTGLAFLLSPNETAEIINKGVGAIGDVAETIVDTTLDVADSATSGLFGSTTFWVIGGLVVAYLVLSSDKQKVATDG